MTNTEFTLDCDCGNKHEIKGFQLYMLTGKMVWKCMKCGELIDIQGDIDAL